MDNTQLIELLTNRLQQLESLGQQQAADLDKAAAELNMTSGALTELRGIIAVLQSEQLPDIQVVESESFKKSEEPDI